MTARFLGPDTKGEAFPLSAQAEGGPLPMAAAPLRPSCSLEERRLIAQIGRYTVLGEIANGGMGSVFVAQMRGAAAFSRLVAIKCLHTRWLEDAEYVARFTKEVKLSTLIRHPNVVQTLDVVEEGGELFLVMDYVDGVTLSHLLGDLKRAHGALPVPLALGILAAVLRGLHAAHEAIGHDGAPCHIVHRDVSPQNIMLGRNGHVQVLDFGAAKAIDDSHTGKLVGKLAYMAPEQVRGERLSRRADIFSAGVVLWESLVGRRLFQKPGLNRSDRLEELVLKPVPRPSRLRSEVPSAVDEVVKKALARTPERRFQTALEFAIALESIGGVPSAAEVARLIAEACAERLAKKEAWLRAGLAAAAQASETPVLHALSSAPPPSLERVPLPAVPPRRHSPVAWLGGALFGASAFWWALGAVRALGVGSEQNNTAQASAAHPQSNGRESNASKHRFAGQLTDFTGLSLANALPARNPQQATGSSFASVTASAIASPAFSFIAGAEPDGSGAESAAAVGEPPREATLGTNPLGGRPRALSAAHSGAAARACDPPTYIDAAGIRHFKKACL